MSEVLLFGGGGLIGSRILQMLSQRLHIIAPSHKDLNLIEHHAVKDFITVTRPDTILYAAGVTNPDKAEEEKAYALLINATIPAKIAALGKDYNIPVIYLSTDAVFQGDQKHPYRESDPTNPVNFYGLTKQKGELAVQNASPKNCILRLITVYSHYYPQKKDLVRLAVETLQKNEVFTGIIDQYINPTYVDDAVLAIEQVIEKNITGILHVGAKNSVSNFTFIEMIAKICGFRKDLIQETTLEEFCKNKKAQRGMYTSLDVKRAADILGEKYIHSLEDGLRRFKDAYRRQRSSS